MHPGTPEDSVGLEWVLHEGSRVRVSTFASLRPSRRPVVFCTECGERVTPKLGTVRRHHAAHRRGSRCTALNPETALHLNVKYHIAAVLADAIGTPKPVLIRRACVVGNRPYVSGSDVQWIESTAERCLERLDEPWLEGWDEVLVESALGGDARERVPDIVLRRAGKVIGAVEVLVSHAVDAEKAAVLAALEVPWIEILAEESLHTGPGAWTSITGAGPARGSCTPLPASQTAFSGGSLSIATARW